MLVCFRVGTQCSVPTQWVLKRPFGPHWCLLIFFLPVLLNKFPQQTPESETCPLAIHQITEMRGCSGNEKLNAPTPQPYSTEKERQIARDICLHISWHIPQMPLAQCLVTPDIPPFESPAITWPKPQNFCWLLASQGTTGPSPPLINRIHHPNHLDTAQQWPHDAILRDILCKDHCILSRREWVKSVISNWEKNMLFTKQLQSAWGAIFSGMHTDVVDETELRNLFKVCLQAACHFNAISLRSEFVNKKSHCDIFHRRRFGTTSHENPSTFQVKNLSLFHCTMTSLLLKPTNVLFFCKPRERTANKTSFIADNGRTLTVHNGQMQGGGVLALRVDSIHMNSFHIQQSSHHFHISNIGSSVQRGVAVIRRPVDDVWLALDLKEQTPAT